MWVDRVFYRSCFVEFARYKWHIGDVIESSGKFDRAMGGLE